MRIEPEQIFNAQPPEQRPYINFRGVHKALIETQRILVRDGISKSNIYKQGNTKYRFRGIEDTLAAVSAAMVESGVHWTFEILEKTFVAEEYTDKYKNVKNRFTLTLLLRFTFYAEDGSSVSVDSFGIHIGYEAAKLFGQLTSYLVKETLFKKFLIPVEGMDLDDPDSLSPAEMPSEDPKASEQAKTPKEQKKASKPSKNAAKKTSEAPKDLEAAAKAARVEKVKAFRLDHDLSSQDIVTFMTFLFGDEITHPAMLDDDQVNSLFDYAIKLEEPEATTA